MKMKYVALLFLSVLLTGALAQAGGEKNILKAGQEGKFTLTEQTRVGGNLLQPGDYIVQHRVIGADHFVRFQQAFPGNNETVQLTPSDVGVLKCTVESLGQKAKETRIFTEKQADGLHITRVEVTGDDVAHIF